MSSKSFGWGCAKHDKFPTYRGRYVLFIALEEGPRVADYHCVATVPTPNFPERGHGDGTGALAGLEVGMPATSSIYIQKRPSTYRRPGGQEAASAVIQKASWKR